MLTVKRLKEVLHYNPETGVFTRLLTQYGKPCPPNTPAGWTEEGGYQRISVDGQLYQGHRLAWFYMHGIWPKNLIDHENLKGADNKLLNLREATHTQNRHNSRAGRPSRTGVKGVRAVANGFKVRFSLGKKYYYVGVYPTLLSAEIAAGQFKAIHHKTFAYYGVPK